MVYSKGERTMSEVISRIMSRIETLEQRVKELEKTLEAQRQIDDYRNSEGLSQV